ncbi:hypothetical protein TWF706_006164 [Orbilia oligospora]|nr:hypothetical protein TWF706_006164 [Orbilia oligospora]
MRSTTIAICGFGPRGRLFHNIYIAEQLALLWQGKPIDKTPRTHDYYEMQSKKDGPGAAFQSECHAAMNTGLQGPVAIDKEGLSPQQCNTIDRLTDVASRYTEIVMADPERTLQSLFQRNTSTAALFISAVNFESKQLNTKIPCGPRGIFGQALEAMTQEALDLARRYLPWLNINIMYNAHVLKIDLADPTKPALTIESIHTRVRLYKSYDLVLKPTGTTWKVPVSGDVGIHAYTGIPNANTVTTYLAQRNILNQEGIITPGSSIFIGGNLSAYDFIGLILARTKIIRLQPGEKQKKLEIDENEAKKYPNLIKLFKRKEGELCAPRHADGMDAKIPEGFGFITPEMLLALQIQKREYCNPYTIIFELTRIVTAIALNKAPGSIEQDLSTEEQLDHMAAENEKFAANPKAITETGMIRRCLVSFYCTITTAPNTTEQRSLLSQRFPLLIREPWDAFRALNYDITPTENPFAIRSSRKFWNHITSSAPFAAHLLITRLYKLGVISWLQGAYEDIKWSPLDMRFNLNEESSNGLIAPRVLSEKTDILNTSLLEQAMKPGGGEAVYQKGRTLLSPSGDTIHVIELGIPGHGGVFDGAPTRRAQWLDTNAYESGHQLMPSVVSIVRIIESMISLGVPRPFNALSRYYKSILPKRQDFIRQCNEMKGPYEELVEILEYSRLVEVAYPERYAEKMREGIGAENRRRVISEIREMSNDHSSLQAALTTYDKRHTPNNKFVPISQKTFEKITPDFSLDQIRKMKDIWSRESHRIGSVTIKNHQLAHAHAHARGMPTGLPRLFVSQRCIKPTVVAPDLGYWVSDSQQDEGTNNSAELNNGKLCKRSGRRRSRRSLGYKGGGKGRRVRPQS